MRLEKAAAAIASHSLEKAQEKAKEWNIPRSYGSYEALLEDEDINVVYVAMINSEHYKYALKSLEAGKHVICEKPFTLKKEEAEHLFHVAKEKNLFLAEVQKSVFLPLMQDLKKMIAEGKLEGAKSSCTFEYRRGDCLGASMPI